MYASVALQATVHVLYINIYSKSEPFIQIVKCILLYAQFIANALGHFTTGGDYYCLGVVLLTVSSQKELL